MAILICRQPLAVSVFKNRYMKKSQLLFLFFFLLFAAPASLFAQDVIYKADGTKIEAKVLEIGISEIRYKVFTNQDGPVYVISKNDVALITYQNGTHELFIDQKDARKQARNDSLAKNRNKNLVSLNLLDAAYSNLTLSYERIFGKGYIGVRVPVTLGLRTLSNENHFGYTFNEGALWGTGVSVNFYPTGQGRVKYYLGPSFLMGAFRHYRPYLLLQRGMSYSYIPSGYETAMHYAVVINNGLILQPTKNLNLAFALGLGMKEDDSIYPDRIEPKVTGTFNIGYRF